MPGIAAIPAAMCFSNGLDVCLRSIPSIIKRGWYRSIIGAHMRPGEALIASLQRHRPRSSKTTLSSPVNARAPPHASTLCCRPNSCISMRWAEVGERSATEGPLVCNNIMAPSMVSKATQRQLTYPSCLAPGSCSMFGNSTRLAAFLSATRSFLCTKSSTSSGAPSCMATVTSRLRAAGLMPHARWGRAT